MVNTGVMVAAWAEADRIWFPHRTDPQLIPQNRFLPGRGYFKKAKKTASTRQANAAR